ncbi:unnamed protein product [Cochlearia groenlandica]
MRSVLSILARRSAGNNITVSSEWPLQHTHPVTTVLFIHHHLLTCHLRHIIRLRLNHNNSMVATVLWK